MNRLRQIELFGNSFRRFLTNKSLYYNSEGGLLWEYCIPEK